MPSSQNSSRPASLSRGALALVFLCLAACQAKKPQAAAPGIDSLKEVLQQAAEKKLEAPGLANEQMTVSARPEQAEACAAEILNAAVAAGGTGIKSVQDGVITILAKVPGHNREIFRGLVRHEKVDRPVSTAPPGQMELIQVRVQTSPAGPAASPTPP